MRCAARFLCATLLASLAVTLLPAVSFAEPCLDYAGHDRFVYNVGAVDPVRGVAASGNTFYLARNQAFEVWDGTDPAAPTRLGSTPMDGGARHVVLDGNLAYVPVWWRPFGLDINELRLVDVSDPAAPALVATALLSPGEAHDVAVANGYAYVAMGSGDVAVVDVDPPESSAVQRTVEMPGEAWGVTILGNRLIVAVGWRGVRVYDLTDPVNPVWTATKAIALPREAIDVAHDGDPTRVVASIRFNDTNTHYRTSEIWTLDVTDPAAAIRVGRSDALRIGRVEHLVVDGDRVYAAASSESNDGSMVHVLDVSDATAPVTVGFVAVPPESAQGIALLGDHVVLGEGKTYQGTGAWQVLDVSDPWPPLLASQLIDDSLLSPAVRGTELYLAQWGAGLTIRDVTDPEFAILATIPDCFGRRLEFSGHILWAAAGDQSWGNLQSYDVSDPSSPVALGTFTPRTGIVGADLDIDTGLLYLAEAHYGYAYTEGFLEIVDTSDPAEPELVGTIDFGSSGVPYAQSLVVHDGYLYLPWHDELVTYDLSDPTAPMAVGTPVPFPGAITWVERRDDLLLVAARDGSFHVLSLADPAAPLPIGVEDLPSLPWRIEAVGDVAYVACHTTGLEVVSIETPSAPEHQGGVSPGYNTWDLAPAGDRIVLLAGRGRREHIVTVPCAALTSSTGSGPFSPTAPAAAGLRVAPNPFRPETVVTFTLERSGRVDLVVFDVAGRRVRRLVDRVLPGRAHRVAWDGRTDAGREAAAGVYFVRLRTRDGVRSEVVTRLR